MVSSNHILDFHEFAREIIRLLEFFPYLCVFSLLPLVRLWESNTSQNIRSLNYRRLLKGKEYDVDKKTRIFQIEHFHD